MSKILTVICAVIFLLMSTAGQVYANTVSEKQRFATNAPWYWPGLNCAGNSAVATGSLPKLIPEPYNGAFTEGGNKHKVAPALVAAIFTEENMTHTQTSQLASAWQQFVAGNYGGAHRPVGNVNAGWPTNQFQTMGPFQFIPGTWATYGQDGNNDGKKDAQNLVDAADGAANYLAANGGTIDKPASSWQNAIFAYNHAQWYVDAVMTYYNFYTGGKAATSTSTPPSADSVAGNFCNGGSVTVDCNGAKATDVKGLSNQRQTAVCIAQNELSKWKTNKMHSGFRHCNDTTILSTCDSFAKYTQNNDYLWCASFVSWVYYAAGYSIGDGNAWQVAGVSGIQQIGEKGGRWHWHPIGSYKPKPGDLVIHGGNHVNMVVAISKDGKGWSTIGGDQGGGPYPDGSIVSGYPVSGPSGDPPAITGFVSPD